MRGRRLGVEASGDRLLSVAVSRGRISSAKAIALPPAGAPTGRLALQPHFGAAPVHVAISDRDNVHRLLLVPPMTAAERSEVVSRESQYFRPQGVETHYLSGPVSLAKSSSRGDSSPDRNAPDGRSAPSPVYPRVLPWWISDDD